MKGRIYLYPYVKFPLINYGALAIYVWLHLFQRNYATQKTFYKFLFLALFIMVGVIVVLGIFLSASKLGDSGYDIEQEATTSQPSTATSN